MLLSIPAGTTSKIIEFPIYDSSSSVGSTLAGLVYNSTTLTAYYNRESASGASVAITLANMTKGTWTSEGFVAVDGTNMPGWYQLGLPNAAIAVGSKYCSIMLKGATNMVPASFMLQLIDAEISTAQTGALTDLVDGGRLDLLVDAIKTSTDRLTATAASALTDWVDGGRLDLLQDAIKVSTDRLTATVASTISDWENAGRLDTILDAIKVGSDRLTATAASTIADWENGGRLDLIIDAVKVSSDRLTATAASALTDLVDGGRTDLLIDAIKVGTDRLTSTAVSALTDLNDGGRLDLLVDAIKVGTDRITATAASVLTDWENGGRLDAILDLTATGSALTALSGSLATASEIASTVAAYADIAALTATMADGGRTDLLIDAIKVGTDRLTATAASALTDLNDGGRLDLLVDAIKAKTDLIFSGITKNVALAKFTFVMRDSTNHAPATGKTVTVTRSIDGAAFGAGAISGTGELSNGTYYTDLAAADLNGKVIVLRATATDCDDTFVTLVTDA